MDAAGYSIRDIARELSLPESTIRYYRDAFALYLPAIGMGRRRRYPREAVDIFRVIADSYAHNLSRDEIEAHLQQSGVALVAAPEPTPPLPRTMVGPRHDEMVATLEDERERRDLMWQMAREIVRMGERFERQQMLLGEIARRLEENGDRTLPAGGGPLRAIPAEGTADRAPGEVERKLADELTALREELEKERELVERLRRSKLEIERRAMQAETALREGGQR